MVWFEIGLFVFRFVLWFACWVLVDLVGFWLFWACCLLFVLCALLVCLLCIVLLGDLVVWFRV